MTAESDTGASERMRCSAPLHEMLTDWSSPCSLTRTEMRPEEKATSCALISGAMAAASSLIASESSERPGGHEVAVKTADLLGIRVYERELIRLACEYGELSEKTLSPSDEKATAGESRMHDPPA